MPELPEVETVVRDLNELLEDRPKILRFHFYRKDLRDPIPIKKVESLVNESITHFRRRAKYIIMETAKGNLLSHLGMTGAWRLSSELNPKKHDHVAIEFSNGSFLLYSDPRRFGYLGFFTTESHPKLKDLGPEPLSKDFTSEYLKQKLSNKHTPIKSAIMDQEVVVGVGNIYASEALFLAKISPKKKANRLTLPQIRELILAIQKVLSEAIKAGGSSIRTYISAKGQSGGFQQAHLVYDRDGLPCKVCGTKVRQAKIGARSTFWCPSCQK